MLNYIWQIPEQIAAIPYWFKIHCKSIPIDKINYRYTECMWKKINSILQSSYVLFWIWGQCQCILYSRTPTQFTTHSLICNVNRVLHLISHSKRKTDLASLERKSYVVVRRIYSNNILFYFWILKINKMLMWLICKINNYLI